MSSRDNEQCDCRAYSTFPHRRKKCAFGIGKSKDIKETPTAASNTNFTNNAYECPPVQAAIVMDSGGGNICGDPVEAYLYVPPEPNVQQQHPRPQQQTNAGPAKPPLSDRLYNAFESGLVSGTYMGTTLATSQVVRNTLLSATTTVVNGVSSAVNGNNSSKTRK